MWQTLTSFIYRLLASTKFFVGTVALLAIQSIWLALTGIYPLPFDEYTHIGITQIYTHQWLPFIATQPPEAGLYAGDITRNPSYLYSYLLSFPYRALETFTDNQTALIISMRLITIIMVCVGLVLFHKLLLTWGISRRITHFVLLVFVCTPIVPFLAGQVNYDNLMFMLTPLFLLFATYLLKQKNDILKNTILLLTIGMATTLVKHNFLPILLIVSGYVAGVLIYRNRQHLQTLMSNIWQGRPQASLLILLVLPLLLFSGLFIERHGLNTIRYGTIAPDCAQVQPETVCADFMPWYRNRQNVLDNKIAEQRYGNPISYTQHWVSKITRGYFAIFSHTPTNVISPREPFGPIVLKGLLPLPIVFGSVAFCLGSIALLLRIKQLWRNQFLRLAIILCTGFLVVLWLFNYQLYLELGVAQTIQARYTLPILILMLALVAQAVNSQIKSRQMKTGLVVVTLALYCYGGGIAGYLIRADQNWYWQNPTVIRVNQSVQNVLKNIMVH